MLKQNDLSHMCCITDHLDLSNNQLDSYFPPQWTSMVSLQTLDISHNSIKGEIPRSIVEMNNLRELNLSGQCQFLLSSVTVVISMSSHIIIQI